MQNDNDQQNAIKQLKVANNMNTPQGSLVSSQKMGVPQSFSSCSLDQASQFSMEASVHSQRQLSSAIAALRRDNAADDVAASTVADQGAAKGQTINNPNNELTSLLLAQLFDFTQNVVDRAAGKGQQATPNSQAATAERVDSLSLKLASISTSLANSVADSVAESQSISRYASLLASESASLSQLQDSIVQSLSMSAALANQQSESLAQEVTTPGFIPEMAEHSFRNAVLKRQLDDAGESGQLATAAQTAPAVSLEDDKHTSTVELRQKVHRTVLLNLPSGEVRTAVQTHTFVRSGEKDDRTGKVTWGSWDQARFVLPAFAIPTLIGYRHQPSQIPPLVVYPNGADTTVQVKYQLEPVSRPKQNKVVSQPKEVKKQPAIDHVKLNEEIKKETKKEQPVAKAKRSRLRRKKKMTLLAVLGVALYTMFIG